MKHDTRNEELRRKLRSKINKKRATRMPSSSKGSPDENGVRPSKTTTRHAARATSQPSLSHLAQMYTKHPEKMPKAMRDMLSSVIAPRATDSVPDRHERRVERDSSQPSVTKTRADHASAKDVRATTGVATTTATTAATDDGQDVASKRRLRPRFSLAGCTIPEKQVDV